MVLDKATICFFKNTHSTEGVLQLQHYSSTFCQMTSSSETRFSMIGWEPCHSLGLVEFLLASQLLHLLGLFRVLFLHKLLVGLYSAVTLAHIGH